MNFIKFLKFVKCAFSNYGLGNGPRNGSGDGPSNGPPDGPGDGLHKLVIIIALVRN